MIGQYAEAFKTSQTTDYTQYILNLIGKVCTLCKGIGRSTLPRTTCTGRLGSAQHNALLRQPPRNRRRNLPGLVDNPSNHPVQYGLTKTSGKFTPNTHSRLRINKQSTGNLQNQGRRQGYRQTTPQKHHNHGINAPVKAIRHQNRHTANTKHQRENIRRLPQTRGQIPGATDTDIPLFL